MQKSSIVADVLSAPHTHLDSPYPSNLLPNPRDIPSPWGSMRTYEWGPTTGRKALLIHGLSTPSPALAFVGQGLVEGGCRVMIIGMFTSTRYWKNESLKHQ